MCEQSSRSNNNNKIDDVPVTTTHKINNTTRETSATGMRTDTTTGTTTTTNDTNTTAGSISYSNRNECKLLAISSTTTGSTTSISFPLPYPSYTLIDTSRKHVPVIENNDDNDYYFDYSYTDTVTISGNDNRKQRWISDWYYNNKTLVQKLIGDVIVGATVSLAIAPVLSVIDKAVVERVSMNNTNHNNNNTAKSSILHSVQGSIVSIVRNPFIYLRSPAFTWMWFTYSVTYITANSLRTITSHDYIMNSSSNVSSSSSNTPTTTTNTTNTANSTSNNNNFTKSSSASIVFIGTTIVNSISSMLKDRAYAQMFSNSSNSTMKQRTVVPLLSYGLWIGRDITVIGSSFIIPTYICPTIQNLSGLSYTNSLQISQIVSPILAQFVATSFHCIGLDYVNRPTIVLPTVSSSSTTTASIASSSSLLLPNNNNCSRSPTSIYNLSTSGTHRHTHTHAICGSSSNQLNFNTMILTLQNRYNMLQSCFVEVVTARIARVIPAYGIGGVYNTHYRNQWHTMVTTTNSTNCT